MKLLVVHEQQVPTEHATEALKVYSVSTDEGLISTRHVVSSRTYLVYDICSGFDLSKNLFSKEKQKLFPSSHEGGKFRRCPRLGQHALRALLERNIEPARVRTPDQKHRQT